MYAQVIVDIAVEEVDRVFTYRVPQGMTVGPGYRVSVPFGPRMKEGYVLKLTQDAAIEAGFRDDLTVSGRTGTKGDPDLEVAGYSAFGTNYSGASFVTSGVGSAEPPVRIWCPPGALIVDFLPDKD